MNLKKIWNSIINNPYIHPIIWSIFPILTLYNHNLDETWPRVAYTPIVYSLLFAVISFIIFTAFLRNVYKAGVMTSVWLILVFSYGHYYLYLSTTPLITILPVSLNLILLPANFFLLIGTEFLLYKHKGNATVFVNMFSVVGIILTAMSLYQIIPYEVRRIYSLHKIEKYKTEHKEIVTVKNKDTSTYPDIYYFIFDRYGRQDVLKENFNYDNTKFLKYLEEKDFIVDRKATANYPTTFLSIASSLNMEHLTFLPKVLGEEYTDKTVVYTSMLEDNEVVRFLKDRGYKYFNYGSVWKGFMQSRLADANYNLFIDFDEFLYYLYENTLINAVWGKLSGKQFYIGELRLQKSAENQFYRLGKIQENAPSDSPKFVFAHFLLPHPPYLLGDDCTPLDFEVIRSRTQEAGFRSQTSCANKFMKIFAEEIQKKSKRPAVIVFQSDEGPYLPTKYFPNEKYPKKSPETSFKIHSKILSAIYLPPAKKNEDQTEIKKKFAEGRTPVNTFRLIFNYYFGTDYKLQENRVYVFTDDKIPFKLREITDIVR